MAQLLDGPFQLATLQGRLDVWEAEIAAAVADDPVAAGAFPGALAQLRADLPLLRLRLENTLAGVPSVPFGLALVGVNDFESTDALGFALGTDVWAAAPSSASAVLETADPIAGLADARLEFEFRDSGVAWAVAALMRFSFVDGAAQDLTASGVTSIRIRARADQARTMRIDLESPAHSMGNAGQRFGWVVDLSVTAQTFDLVLGDATLPAWALPNPDVLADILQQVVGLGFMPGVLGLDGQGFLGDGVSDPGWIEVEDIEFVVG